MKQVTELEQLIAGINAMLRMKDISEATDGEDLAFNYALSCTEFNDDVNECFMLTMEEKIVDAAALAQTLSIKARADLLNFPKRDQFLELCTINDWRVAEDLNLQALDDLNHALANSVSLNDLLQKNRALMRSDDIGARVQVLHQLIKADSAGSGKWIEMVRPLETQLLVQYYDRAKNAIIKKDFRGMKQILRELNSDAWQTPPERKVVDKIQDVLNREDIRVFCERRDAIVGKINDAYSAFDTPKLGDQLFKWKNLLTTFPAYPVPEEQVTQVAEAEEFFNRQKADEKVEKQYQDLLEKLKDSLHSPQTLPDAENIIMQIRDLEREIPEDLADRYADIKNSMDAAARRRTKLMIGAIAGAAVLVIALAAMLIYNSRMNSLENEWYNNLQKELREKSPESALELWEKAQKVAPAITQRPRLAVLGKEIADKKAQADHLREQFQARAGEFKNILRKGISQGYPDDGDTGKGALKVHLTSLKKLIGKNPASQEEYDALVREKDIFEENRRQKAEREYAEVCGEISSLCAYFYGFLGENNFSDAENQITLVDEKLRSADRISLPQEFTAQYAKTLDKAKGLRNELAEAKNKLAAEEKRREEEKKAQQKATEDLAKLKKELQEPVSLENFKDILSQMCERMPTSPETLAYAKCLKNSIPEAEELCSHDSSRLSACFIEDYSKEIYSDDNLAEKIGERLKTLKKALTAEQGTFGKIHTIVIRPGDKGDFCYHFYYGSKQQREIENGSTTILAKRHGPGYRQITTLHITTFKPEDVVIKDDGGFIHRLARVETESGTFIHPSTGFSKILAEELPQAVSPDIEFIDRQLKTLQNDNRLGYIRIFRETLNNDIMNPVIKLKILKCIVQNVKLQYKNNCEQWGAENWKEIATALGETNVSNELDWYMAFRAQYLETTKKLFESLKKIAKNYPFYPIQAQNIKIHEKTLEALQRIEAVGYLRKDGDSFAIVDFVKNARPKNYYVYCRDTQCFVNLAKATGIMDRLNKGIYIVYGVRRGNDFEEAINQVRDEFKDFRIPKEKIKLPHCFSNYARDWNN